MAIWYSETEVVARVEGMTVTRLRAFVANHCLEPEERDGHLVFREVDVARVELLADLAGDFELDEDAAALVVRLVDQIHGLRRRLRSMGAALAEEPEEIRIRIGARIRD